MGHWTSITERTARRWHNTFPPAIATLVNTHTEKLDLAGHSTLPLGICNFVAAMLFFFFFFAQNKQFTSNALSVLQIWPFPLTSSNLLRQWQKLKKKKKKSQPLIKKHVRVALQFHPWLATVLKAYIFTASKQKEFIGLPNTQKFLKD